MNGYEELVRRAVIDGDTAASDQLVRLGERHLIGGHLQDAAKMFKAAAAAYQFKAEDNERWFELTRTIYQRWFDERLCTLRDWPTAGSGISDDFVRQVVVEQLLNETRFTPIFAYLEEVLAGLGMSFYSPGAASSAVFGSCWLNFSASGSRPTRTTSATRPSGSDWTFWQARSLRAASPLDLRPYTKG
jgi:hypothetical protein